jgi:hypothetical protein
MRIGPDIGQWSPAEWGALWDAAFFEENEQVRICMLSPSPYIALF